MSPMILKVLSGPHRGAEVPVAMETELSIGNDDACDVVLVDESLLGKHAVIGVEISGDASKIRLAPFDGALCHVDGKLCREAIEIQPFQYILIGKTLLTIGPKEGEWPDLSEDKAPAIEVDEPQVTPTETENIDVEPNNPQSTPPPPKPKRKWWIVWILPIVVGAGIWRGLSLTEEKETKTVVPIDGNEKPPPPPPQLTREELIRNVLSEMKIEWRLTNVTTINGTPKVETYVPTEEMKKELKRRLMALNIHANRIVIRCQETFLATARNTLKNLKYVLYVEPLPSPDALQLRGYLMNINVLPSVKEQILTDAIGLKTIETNILSFDDVNEMLNGLLEKYNFVGLVKPVAFETGVVLAGSIEDRNEKLWKQFVKECNTTFEGMCSILFRVAIVPAYAIKQSFFEAPIESVTVSPDAAWIDLKNGQRYFETSLLPSGYFIKRIGTDGLDLVKNEEFVHLKPEDL
jgi:type III secretion system YscD/HrpQ family protein